MSNRVPKDIQELMDQVHDTDKLLEFAGKWNEYARTNSEYERNYPMQFANLVEGNLKFKQDKTIPTPSEQMEEFRDLMRDELNDYLNELQQDKQAEVEAVEQEPVDNPLDQPQELMLTWMKEYKEEQAQRAQYVHEQDKEEEKTDINDFKLNFGHDDYSENDYEPANDNQPEMDEPERD